MATSQAPTATEYIVHHLTHLATGKQKFIVDFSVVNVDTVFFSAACLALTLFLLQRAARAATAGVPGRFQAFVEMIVVPGRFQAFVEMIVEMVEEQSKSIVHGDRTFIAPLAITVFIWIIFMNAIDLIPVDLFPWIALNVFGIHYLRPLPTADLNGTLGMAIGVLLLMIYYGVKIKGFGGWVHELFTAPFGANPLLWPFNFLLNLIEYLAKTVSLGMRLFGNARHATFRQHVRGRTAVLPHRAARRNLGLPHRQLAAAGARSRARRHGLAAVPHPDRAPAGVHLHDADARLHRAGARRSLTVFASHLISLPQQGV